MDKYQKNNAIGIIGGMGPEASRYFYGLIIKYAQEIYHIGKNENFPEIYLASIPVPDFINSAKNRNKALEMLQEKIIAMNSLPVTFYCLACNTAHLLLADLQKETDKPFISLLDELPKYLQKRKIKKVGLLATPTTIKSGLYVKELNQVGIKIIAPNEKDIPVLGKIIKDTIAGKNLEENGIKIQKIAASLLQTGADAIVESCTEIPLIFPKQHLVPVFDALEILAQAVLKKYYLLQ